METTEGEQLAFFEAPPAPVPAFGEDPALDAVQAERLKQMRQACWLVMNIPQLRALIAEESAELSHSNVESLTERLDGLSEVSESA